MKTVDLKLERFHPLLTNMGGVVVGYSGGVDSTMLAAAAKKILGDRAVCALASSETYPASEVQEALETASILDMSVIRIDTDELRNEAFAANTPDRCFFCKTELFSKLIAIRQDHGIKWVADGANLDDLDDYRPGSMAASQLGVRSPTSRGRNDKE
ncbi:MAG: hypothetical protein ABIA59_02345 [Candidatus Latescibacterota bacterium]